MLVGEWVLSILATLNLQVIEVPGYTVEEKVQIAVRHLLPKVLEVGASHKSIIRRILS